MVRRRRVHRRKPGATANQPPLSDSGLHHGRTPPYSPFSREDTEQIINAALDLMSQTGVGFDPEPQLLERLGHAGCEVSSSGLVKFPPELIQKSLRTVAKRVRLWDRNNENYIEIDSQHTWFCPGMTCIKIYDEETGSARDSNREDLARVTRVSDALENIDVVCVTCKNVDESNIYGEIDEFSVLAENTTKPLIYLCEYAESLEVVKELASIIRGGRKALAEHPYFLHLVTPLPLYFAKTHTDQIISAVEAGVPITVGTVTIGGASAPITIAGCLVHALATDLTAIVLSQVIREGSFCIGSSDASFMEAATGAIGAPSQSALAEMAMCEIFRMLEIPRLTSTAGCSMARRFNQDAATEISSNMMQAFFSRPAICPYMGSLDEGITFSLHGLLFGNDLAGQLRCMWQGIAINDEMLALDLTRAEGPRGNYLANTHTAKYCRLESWESHYFGAHYPIASGALPDEELVERIDRGLQKILLNHHPVKLPTETLSKLQSTIETFKENNRGFD